jgi:hypothetical protein
MATGKWPTTPQTYNRLTYAIHVFGLLLQSPRLWAVSSDPLHRAYVANDILLGLMDGGDYECPRCENGHLYLRSDLAL